MIQGQNVNVLRYNDGHNAIDLTLLVNQKN